ncbi:MAG: alpha/beta hydrolase [Acholeplasmataceae bacterium]|nr:alpha/beta hydrolase [Bacilli bacterium]MDD3421980.1 alpha/beta hydrolase [Bacilli bacterium]MDD4065578.1 alpha/beta hydrolase [Bacilli bacterium]
MAEFKYKNKKVYYETFGKGKPIIILNGIMMSTKSWYPFKDAFSNNNQLILVDFLDQGQSEKMPGEKYNHSIQVELVDALLDELKLKKASIVGISYGGEVGLEYACLHQDRVDRLVLFNTCAYTNPWLNDIGKAWNIAAESGNGKAYYYTAIPVIYSPHFYEQRLDWMRNREKVLFPLFSDHKFTDAMIRLTNSSEDYDVRPLLKDLKTPTLIIGCEQDYLTPMSNQEYLVEHLPNAFYVKVPGVGHGSMYEKPILFVTFSLGFVNALTTEYLV